MTEILNIIQLILAIILIVLVLVQQQDSGFYSSTSNINRSRRGSEKLMFNSTILVIILFTLVSVANVLV